MKQLNKVLIFENKIVELATDRDKIILAYHRLEEGNPQDLQSILSMVSLDYYVSGLHKDIARALLCYLTVTTTMNDEHYKESEFYLIVYRLVKYIVLNKLEFPDSIHFYNLKDELFKDLM